MSLPILDLIAWVADSHQEQTLRGLLTRTQSLRIKQPTFQIYVDRRSDPGCRMNGPESLRSFSNQFRFALLMLDYEGSGATSITSEELEGHLQQRLNACGWLDRSAVIVIEPELEAWIWSSSKEVDSVLGWRSQLLPLRSWMQNEGLVADTTSKPTDPKFALDRVLRTVKKKASGAIYRQLAERVALNSCVDRSFVKLKSSLQLWFTPLTSTESSS